MLKTIVQHKKETIDLSEVAALSPNTPILAYRDNGVVGMLVREVDGCILRFLHGDGSTGYCFIRNQCIIDTLELDMGYTFKVGDKTIVKNSETSSEIHISNVNLLAENTPILIYVGNKIEGMIVKRREGYVLMYPKGYAGTGHYPTRQKCITSILDMSDDYTCKADV